MSRPQRRRESTSTSSFGVGRREGHDASAFYSRFPVPEISDDADVAPPACVDELWVGDARDMDRCGDIADSSVALVVTSPPYYAGKEYEEAIGEGHVPASYIDYLDMLHDVFAECVRKLEPGGRIAVNVANLGRRPYRSLSADVIDILQNRLKLLLRGEVIWHKARGAAGSCAWGTFQTPGNPVFRDLTERVVIASKGRFNRAIKAVERAEEGLPSVGSAFADEYMEATTDVWEIRPASATRVGHPAPFPIELPQRLIDLYTYRGDLVLDPFMGSGTTAVAAVRTGRRYVGFDTDADYTARAEQRVREEHARRAALSGPARWEVEIEATSNGNGKRQPPSRFAHTPGPVILTSGHRDATGEGVENPQGVPRGENLEGAADEINIDAAQSDNFQARAVREGLKARDLAEQTLARCGFSEIRERVRCPGGVEVNFEALDRSGRKWRFDVSGAFTVTQRPGLRRTDTLWKALGKAAALHFAECTAGTPCPPPLVLLTTDPPARNSAGYKALAATTGVGMPIRDVIEMLDPADLARLADLARGGQTESESARRRLH